MYEKYSVLFVDDEVNILNSLRRALMEEEYTCFFAGSAKEALEVMEKKEIHVIVTDMRMPVMTGLELLKIVAEKSPMTVKLVLSGYTQLPQILVTINQVDIYKFITKPWSLDELMVVITKSLNYYIIQEENANYKKILETKNQTYQNMLKRIDEVIYNAKKSSEILGMCGKALLAFGKTFSLEERIKYQNIFAMQDEIFDILSNAVTNEIKDYDSNELIQRITEHMLKTYPNAKIEVNSEMHSRIRVNEKMLEASIRILFIIFADEFKTNGFFPNIESEQEFKFSIISPKVEVEKAVGTKINVTTLDVKIDLVKNILKDVLSMCQITIQIAKISGNLVIGIMVGE
jgi:YesN/AraC family two-component response regulator